MTTPRGRLQRPASCDRLQLEWLERLTHLDTFWRVKILIIYVCLKIPTILNRGRPSIFIPGRPMVRGTRNLVGRSPISSVVPH